MGVIVLGFDVGRKKTGVAIGNGVSGLARPLATVRGGRDAQLQEIGKLVAEWKPQRLIVGMPLYADGTRHKMTKTAEVFGASLRSAFGLPVVFADERYSTIAARAEWSGSESGAGIDAAAAAVILQGWLDGEGCSVDNDGNIG